MIIVSKRNTINLTYGKSYEVIEIDSARYRIINDRGQECTSSMDNFMTIQELRDFSLKKLLV